MPDSKATEPHELQLLLANAVTRQPVLSDGLPTRTLWAAAAPDRVPGLDSSEYLADHGADPNLLDRQRWGIVVPATDAGKRYREAIQPLTEHREAEQGAQAKVYEVPFHASSKEALQWVSRVYKDAAVPPEDRPRYLLVLGDPHEVSADLQQALANPAFVGRVCCPDLQGYRAYAEKVVRWEQQASPQKPRLLFHSSQDGTAAVNQTYQRLLQPCFDQAQALQDVDRLRASEVVDLAALGKTSASDLLAYSQGASPGVLLSVSHGAAVPGSQAEQQRQRQGAMVLREGLWTADEAREAAFLPGGVWFYFACFGAGTPARSVFYPWLKALNAPATQAVLDTLPAAVGGRPFVAALPQALLANPEGPQAVIGHLDLAWTYSFRNVEVPGQRQVQKFLLVLQQLCGGSRVGVAIAELWRAYQELNDRLAEIQQSEADVLAAKGTPGVDPALHAKLWMQRNDLRGYLLLGDPAVRLRS